MDAEMIEIDYGDVDALNVLDPNLNIDDNNDNNDNNATDNTFGRTMAAVFGASTDHIIMREDDNNLDDAGHGHGYSSSERDERTLDERRFLPLQVPDGIDITETRVEYELEQGKGHMQLFAMLTSLLLHVRHGDPMPEFFHKDDQTLYVCIFFLYFCVFVFFCRYYGFNVSIVQGIVYIRHEFIHTYRFFLLLLLLLLQ